MSIPRSVDQVIRDHVTWEVEGIDRRYLNVYQPKLQTEKQVACFFRFHRGQPVASSSLMGVMTNEFLNRVDAFVEEQRIPIVHFKRKQRKDDVAAEYRARFPGTEGVLFLGKAQEKVTVFRTEKPTDAAGKKYAWLVKSATPVNQFYFYCIDDDFGPFFLKFSSYFPYNAKLCLNNHEYVKRQLAQEGIAFEGLDNGVLCCANPKRLQQLCDGRSAAKIDVFLRKWVAKRPRPYLLLFRKLMSVAAGFSLRLRTLSTGRSIAGCPTVGVRTGSSLVRHGVTGYLVERLPPGRQCVASDADEAALVAYLDAIRPAQGMDRQAVREAAAEEFRTERVVDGILAALDEVRTCRP